jgi:DNA-binding transcriptional ArsR family regulator
MKEFLQIIRSLSDETRLELFHLLLTHDLCGKALAQRLGISEAAVSQHLKVLQKAGLVKGEKRGYWVHYSVERQVLQGLISELHLMTKQVPISNSPCSNMRIKWKGSYGKEVKSMCCGPCCEHPEKLKSKPEECTPEQIKECHGDKEHPCETKKK